MSTTIATGNPSNLDPDYTTPALDRTLVQRHTWDAISTDYYNYYAIAYRIRYRQQGTTPWTTSGTLAATDLTGTSQRYYHDFAANTFTAGLTYEWQVQIDENAGGTSDWSTSAYFTSAAAPTNPVITAPSAGATITGGTTSLTWTLTTQYAYRVKVDVDSGGLAPLEYDSGVITNSALRAHTVPLPNPGARWIFLQTQSVVGGPWSAWVSRNVTAAGVPPMTPTFTTNDVVDAAGIGVRHAWYLQANHPAPSGGAPAVTRTEWYIRPVGDTSSGTYIGAGNDGGLGGLPGFIYQNITQGTWEARIKAISADNRSAFSAWVQPTNQPNIRGVVIGHSTSPWTAVYFPYNDEGAKEEYAFTAELLRYVGRKSPVVEYDMTAEDRTLAVDKVSVKTSEQAKLTTLLTLLRTRLPLTYRDKRGRRVIGLLELGSIEDQFYGWDLGLKITEVDYTDAGHRWLGSTSPPTQILPDL